MTDIGVLNRLGPVEGDPARVADLARRYRAGAAELQRQTDHLLKLAREESWDGDAGPEARERLTQAANRVRLAAGRFEAAHAALDRYWPELDEAQRLSRQAEGRRREAEERRRRAQAGLDQLPDDDPGREALERTADEAERDRIAASGDMDRAVADVRRAAREAARSLERFRKGDGLDDDFGDKYRDWVRRNKGWIKTVSEAAGKIAAVAGVAALVFGWVPVIGQVLGLIALAAGALALVADLVLALGGQGDWLSVGLSALTLVTFGAGRALALGAKSAALGAKGAAALEAGGARLTQQAARPLARAIEKAGGRTVPDLARTPEIARALGRSFDDVVGGNASPVMRRVLVDHGFSKAAAKDAVQALQGAPLRRAREAMGMQPAAALDALRHSSIGLRGWGRVAGQFGQELRPGALVVQPFKNLRNLPSEWRAAVSRAKAADLRVHPDATLAEMGSIRGFLPAGAASSPRVLPHLAGARGQVGAWYAVAGAGPLVDTANQNGQLDALKKATMPPPPERPEWPAP